MVNMDLIVQTIVIHVAVLYVNDLKEIVHMDVLKGSQDTCVFPQVIQYTFQHNSNLK
jgi:hypothetical protein